LVPLGSGFPFPNHAKKIFHPGWYGVYALKCKGNGDWLKISSAHAQCMDGKFHPEMTTSLHTTLKV
jgi:hypothetical protein